MATYPKLKACPNSDRDDAHDVYTYESGWRYVECDHCFYRGPGEGSIRQAIKSHNEVRDQRREEHLAALAKQAEAGAVQ